MDAWNFADVWEAVAARFGAEPALIHEDTTLTWADVDRRADAIGAALVGLGLRQQSKVAQMLRNRPEYMESMLGLFKAGLVPVNTNFRYRAGELEHLWLDSDAEAVIFEPDFAEVCAEVRDRVSGVRAWICTGDADQVPAWAIPYADLAGGLASARYRAPWGRRGDDLYLLYTGGTTGLPKGVMWRQDDLFRMLLASESRDLPVPASPRALVDRLDRRGPTVLPAAPLMHGTAAWFSMPALARGGAVVTIEGASFDAHRLLEAIARHGVKGLCIVGDAFAMPILRALDAEPGRWDLSGVRVIMSSGAALSPAAKARLLEVAPRSIVIDSLGSSESGTMARSITSVGEPIGPTRFRLDDRTRVIDEDGRDVRAGSGQEGRLAVGGHLPVGYYKDEAKTASTFVEVAGQRYVVAGDMATVDEHGFITLLGRGSSCINTAGEKVYPEEVEAVLRGATGVGDAAVVGIPHERFGEVVVGLVERVRGATIDPEHLIVEAKRQLAPYKAPRHIVIVDSVMRAANGKLDHRALRAVAAAAVG